MGLFGGYGLRAAFALSKLGERVGSDALIYNPGVFWHFHGMAKANAPPFADELLSFAPDTRSIADVGCGSGAYAAEFNRRGLHVWAGEYAATGRWLAHRQGLTPHRFDVTDPSTHPGKTFDLAYSIEVAEHLPDALADRFVGFLVRMSGLLVVTAAVPGQGGHGHINEQPPSTGSPSSRPRASPSTLKILLASARRSASEASARFSAIISWSFAVSPPLDSHSPMDSSKSRYCSRV